MHSLIIINGVEFPTPEGSFDIKYKSVTNEYEGEDGEKTVEIIREDVATISIGYNGMEEEQLNTLHSALKTVNTVVFWKKGTKTTSKMKLSDVSTPKKHYRHGLSVWGMSFSLEEL